MCDSSGEESFRSRDYAAEYEQLSSHFKEQLETIEALTQEVHCLRNRLQVSERVQTECQSEIDFYQQQIGEAEAACALKILKLKEDHSKAIRDLESRLHCLESELAEVHEKHAVDKAELIKTKQELKEFHDTSPVAALKLELREVTDQLDVGRLACEQHQELNRILLSEKAELMEELNSLKEQLEMTVETLKICKSDQQEQNEAMEELRESLAVAQNELAGLKACPTDSVSRGNSLFAEVEDKRQSMVQKCTMLSKKYNEMKRTYGAKCEEISRLKRENLLLRRQWQEEAEERDNRDVWLQDNYEIRIKELTKMVEDLKRDEKPNFVSGDTNILKYAEHVVETSRKEVIQLREEMERRSSERLNEAKALFIARSEAQTLKAQVMSIHAENIVLRDKIGEEEIGDLPSPGKRLKRLKEVVLTSSDLTTSSTQTESFDEFKNLNDFQGKTSGDEHLDCSSLQTPSYLHSSCEQSVIKSEPRDDIDIKKEENYYLRDCREQSSFELQSVQSDSFQENECISDKSQIEFYSPTFTHPVSLTTAEIKEQRIQVDVNEEVQCLGNELGLSLGSTIVASKVDMEQEALSLTEELKQSLEFNTESNSVQELQSEIPSHQYIDELADYNIDKATHKPNVKQPLPEKEVVSGTVAPNQGPRRSILVRPRPSLIPLDQNAMRKVRFAENPSAVSLVEPANDTPVLSENQPPKRASKPYKCNFVVSKEIEF